ncbi:crotonase/enoyl-CoA hydratase family protein [Aestuariirhabdus sp. Z084]|uniref:crotonase/enoyl-CoA hydratase family protein n=1 Tax=Aestuariirhabdus haliotis TaxID=2918751 RepID=UPI00201B3A93|nr:crotonase/enoyl-CoA hydratase family protein [Aestuariirhabdus haliotis]MCL6416962.1 crotonase/enoyl-CoA hydratase family protein [Aestuariirhabdus haliotis]MCL6420935.1 crotonase/enoyl-CoA hydratase family protein [Aestuariirhabdus haliotis]
MELKTMTYQVDGPVARITLNRPERGNGITMDLPRELVHCVEQADINPGVHVIALSGNGNGFCGGYDLVESAEQTRGFAAQGTENTVLSEECQGKNHDPRNTWDPMLDYQMMSRNVKGFMSLFHADKPVICKVHGFCVAGGTDMALCSDMLVIEDKAKIGYPPARVWGSPTTSLWAYRVGVMRAKRLLFTGDCLTGDEALEWGLAIDSVPRSELDEVFESLIQRVAMMPINQLIMMKKLLNQHIENQGLSGTQLIGTLFDGITRHTPEGYAFQKLATEQGFMNAVRSRDEPYGDFGLVSSKVTRS